MRRAPTERRPHGPITSRYGRMWFDFEAGKVRYEKIEPEDFYIEVIPPWPYTDPRQKGATS